MLNIFDIMKNLFNFVAGIPDKSNIKTDFMKKNYLLPHNFKMIGLIMLVPFLAACIWLLLGPCEAECFTVKVPALFTLDIASTSQWFGMTVTPGIIATAHTPSYKINPEDAENEYLLHFCFAKPIILLCKSLHFAILTVEDLNYLHTRKMLG